MKKLYNKMKKIITILTITLLMSSCENRIADTPLIVKSVEVYNSNICKYTVYSTFKSDLNSFDHENASFLDSCNKFNVGDTIKLYKL